MIERDVLNLLHARYAHSPIDQRKGLPPRYIVIEHPTTGATGPHGIRTLDALVLDRYLTRGHREIHGFEIKCTRADLLRELRDPTKAEAWARYCHRFWIATADPYIADPDELPRHWGMMTVTTAGLAIVKRAKLNKEPRRFQDPGDLVWAALKTDRARRR